VDPPGPQEVITLVDTVVKGIVGDDFDVTLDRAAAFAHIVGVGRAQLGGAMNVLDTARQVAMAAGDAEDAAAAHVSEIDLAEAATNLAMSERALQAAFTASARSFQLTILDYLRLSLLQPLSS
jgi:flagellin-like hook-associated protein FlgL